MARILVADDDREFRELAIFALRFAGHHTMGASNYEETCHFVDLHQADLVLLDTSLLDKWIGEELSELKSGLALPSVPVIYLLELGQELDPRLRNVLEGAELIEKPISADQLIQKVNSYVQKMSK